MLSYSRRRGAPVGALLSEGALVLPAALLDLVLGHPAAPLPFPQVGKAEVDGSVVAVGVPEGATEVEGAIVGESEQKNV